MPSQEPLVPMLAKTRWRSLANPRRTFWSVVLLSGALVWILFGPASAVNAQENPGRVATEKQAGEGEEETARDPVRVVTLGSATGLKSFAPGRWGLARVAVANGSEEPATVRATVHWKSNPELRFGRDVWVPAGATRTTAIPIHLPPHAGANGKTANAGGRREIVGRVESGVSQPGTVSGSRLAQVFPPGATAYVDDSLADPLAPSDVVNDVAYEAVLAMLKVRGLPRMVAAPSERLLPATIEGWDSVRQVVIAGRRLTTEPAAAAALRRWVSEGGRMWIQLNRADTATVQALFGSSVGLAVIDRVPLTAFEIQQGEETGEHVTASFDVDEPIELIRARVDGGQTLFNVDGWPAAVQFQYGRGTVLLTLLDARGWMRPRGPGDPPMSNALSYTDFLALEPMEELASRLYQPDSAEIIDPDAVASYVTDRIGYTIPPRGLVLSVLGLFCLSILLVGLWLSSRQRLEHLAGLTAATALVVALALVVVGWVSRDEVPPTLAEFEFITAFSQTGDYTANGAVAVFQPDQVQADFHGFGTRVDPHMPELEGQIRTWIWTAGERWEWNGTRLPAGVSLWPIRSSGSLAAPVQAVASFGPGGVQGEFTADGVRRRFSPSAETPVVRFEDALICFPHSPPLAANLLSSGAFETSERDRLAAGQFTNAALLDDEQRRRGRLLESWLRPSRGGEDGSGPQSATGAGLPLARTSSQGPMFSEGPILLAWISGGAPTIVSDQATERIATGMVMVPLQLARPAIGTRVNIPSVAIRTRSVASETGQSAIFDNRHERWSYPNSRARTTRLRFQIPDSVLPLRLDSARLVLDCHLPSRPLDVSVVHGEERSSLASLNSPSGEVEAVATDPEWLQLDSQGGWTVDITVGELQSEVEELTLATSGWSIRSSRLEVSGTTLPVQPEVD